jgi:hypothetical protein
MRANVIAIQLQLVAGLLLAAGLLFSEQISRFVLR